MRLRNFFRNKNTLGFFKKENNYFSKQEELSSHYIISRCLTFYHFFILYLKENLAILTLDCFKQLIKIAFSILGLIFLQYLLASSDFLTLKVYYPKTITKNLNYLINNKILTYAQIKDLELVLAQDYYSLEELVARINARLIFYNISLEDRRLIINTLYQIYWGFPSNSNRIGNLFLSTSYEDTLRKETFNSGWMSLSLPHRIKQLEPFRAENRPSYVFSGLSIIFLYFLEAIANVFLKPKSSLSKAIVVSLYVLVMVFCFHQIYFITMQIANKGILSLFQFNSNTKFYTLIMYPISVFDFFVSVALVSDFIFVSNIKVIGKLLTILQIVTFKRNTSNMLLDSTNKVSLFKSKFIKVLKNAFTGDSHYLRGYVDTREGLYSVERVNEPSGCDTTADYIISILAGLLFVLDLISSLVQTLDRISKFYTYLNTTFYKKEQYLARGYSIIFYCFIIVSTVSFWQTIVLLPAYLLQYLISPLIYQKTSYLIAFPILIPMLFIYFTIINDLNYKSTVTFSSVLIYTTVTLYLLVCYLLIEIPVIFRKITLQVYLFNKFLITEYVFDAPINARIIDRLVYNTSDYIYATTYIPAVSPWNFYKYI